LIIADPERALAIAYAPAACRPALTSLFALDERLAGIVAATTEPTIGLIRLAWWRESLERLDREAPPAEPLLQTLATLLPLGITGAALSEIEDGWAALLDGDLDDEALMRHARQRGGSLFALAATLLGDPTTPVATAGEGWALADLGHRHSRPDVRSRARAKASEILAVMPAIWPKALRPLGMLAVLARADAELGGARRQGAPGRLLRMLALRLTGR
jgi:phytoene synthase